MLVVLATGYIPLMQTVAVDDLEHFSQGRASFYKYV